VGTGFPTKIMLKQVPKDERPHPDFPGGAVRHFRQGV